MRQFVFLRIPAENHPKGVDTAVFSEFTDQILTLFAVAGLHLKVTARSGQVIRDSLSEVSFIAF